jgi:ABC-type nitrate/sulfonate/bicarbonate transport system permease component
MSKQRATLLAFALPAALVAAWFLVTSVGGIKSYQLASPADVWRELVALAADGLLWKNLSASLERVALGFSVALGVAIVLATAVGLSRPRERASLGSATPTLARDRRDAENHAHRHRRVLSDLREPRFGDSQRRS